MHVEAAARLSYVDLMPGDPCPWLRQRTQSGRMGAVDSMAGRYLVLCFYGSATQPRARAAIDAMLRHRNHFDDQRACFFGISVDPTDERRGQLRDIVPGIRFLWDFDTAVSRKCGALPQEASADAKGPIPFR